MGTAVADKTPAVKPDLQPADLGPPREILESASKASPVGSDSSDDDVPLQKRATPAKTGNGTAQKRKGKAGPGEVKEEAPKEQPTSPQAKKRKAPAKPRVKVEYDNPGQTKPTPPATDSLRKFYTSLAKEKPDSQLAKKWMCVHGLLEKDDAEAWLDSQGKLKSTSTPKKKRAAPRTSSPAAKRSKPAAKRKAAPKRAKKEESEEEAESGSDSEAEVVRKPVSRSRHPEKRRRLDLSLGSEDEKMTDAAGEEGSPATSTPAKKAGSAPVIAKRKKPTPKPTPPPGSDSDDDAPLAQRK